jgi:predicted enzyme related to lactoylglutathione lyase
VIFAEDFQALVAWHQATLRFNITRQIEDEYRYCDLENETGIRIGVADASEMVVAPENRRNNSVVLQFEVTDVKRFFEHLVEHGGKVAFGPSFDEKDKFWFGGFHDLEGNPFWVVDENCPR